MWTANVPSSHSYYSQLHTHSTPTKKSIPCLTLPSNIEPNCHDYSFVSHRLHHKYAEDRGDPWRGRKMRTPVSFFESFLTQGKKKKNNVDSLKQELLEGIAPLDRGAEATPDDQLRIDQIASKIEALNKVEEPLKCDLLNGKWELLYTTSQSILQSQRPKILRPNGKIYQAINIDTLRAQNLETWPFFNQATANLVPQSKKRVAVKFDMFKIAGVLPIRSRGSGRGQLEITYLDDELRISRGNQGNLFILKMVDPSYKVPP